MRTHHEGNVIQEMPVHVMQGSPYRDVILSALAFIMYQVSMSMGEVSSWFPARGDCFVDLHFLHAPLTNT